MEQVGIFRTLLDGGVLEQCDEVNALQLALQPGVTGVSQVERSHQPESNRNSGFGLYVTSQFCSERGIFRLISGNQGLTHSRGAETFHDWPFSGTCVQLKLNTSDLDAASDRIKEIVTEGEMLAAKEGRISEASLASKRSSNWIY